MGNHRPRSEREAMEVGAMPRNDVRSEVRQDKHEYEISRWKRKIHKQKLERSRVTGDQEENIIAKTQGRG